MLVGINCADLKTFREKSLMDCLFHRFRTSEQSICTQTPWAFIGTINRPYPLQIRTD